MNPLLNLKLTWWENYVVSQMLGSAWRTSLWAKFTESLDNFVAGPGQTVAAFVTGHVDTFVSSVFAGNPFLALMVEGVLNQVLPSLIAAGEAYVESKIGKPSPAPAA
jgi:hypothetical protein